MSTDQEHRVEDNPDNVQYTSVQFKSKNKDGGRGSTAMLSHVLEKENDVEYASVNFSNPPRTDKE